MRCPYCKTENHPDATRCAACASWLTSPAPVREWTRARDGKMLAGVCRGLSNRFGIPVAAARLLFVASILFGGWGILAYLALWIAMPQEKAPEAAPRRIERDGRAPFASVVPPVPASTEIVLSRER